MLMDEPFGAIDPVTRTRLQDEFLRLQAELKKTVVFVTHDIDEAVKMGNRIALLNVGAHLEQYDTPARILGEPATPFVADFVGRDRALKRLQVTTIAASQVEPAPVVAADARAVDVAAALDAAGAAAALVVDADLPGGLGLTERWTGDGTAADHAVPISAVDISATLEDALALLLLGDTGRVCVTRGGRHLGLLTASGIHRALRRSVSEEDSPPSDDDGAAVQGARV
jgi:osmoprotectant transport system ATP-binding protein